jgi:TonB family protein
MSTVEKAFRRNFIVAAILHIALIGGIICWEEFLPRGPQNSAAFVELYTPADILGDLPKGPGHGRGAYASPREPAGVDVVAGPSETMMSADETPAPQPKPVSEPKSDPNEISIPPKNAPKKMTAETKAAETNANTGTATGKKSGATKTTVKAAATTAKATGAGSGETAAAFRNRFAQALAAAEGGTPYGDGKAAGGGEGKSSRIGSPDGSPDGVVGGIGQGSPFWQYYQSVHDKMYEAWEQPGEPMRKNLVATVLIRVALDGSITNVELRNSSGNKLMDDSALAAARKVHLLEPPPDGLVKGGSANITVDFQVEG